ncbi:hypothetical protein [Aliivibrio fischeri]|uniref:hypothetical protein n=1 Tax=Aliivibrio fischeri TaxID=668 RepID=UPI00080E733D|nr:hypothetical protein [Aliivibrio fischeri]OCH01997.1 hypothetical protein A6E10_03725 [Aliivibrio fischeri]OCH03528.1 hypothetical protein A6E09_05150 [Aliivibrio fischeri]OCH11772.1 hypothetical protein A6E11_00930 [Aliivibrio fischeri]OCH30427.1 hypothetical protein A6E13_04285 [Aliivibrio fischeri]OCH62905.1 hypothetical protein A6D98_03955 [Aliivibrio fischeri]
MKLEKTFIAHSMDSFIDVVDSFAFDLKNKNIHCSFNVIENEYWFLKLIKKAFERGVENITFTNGVKYTSSGHL